MKSDGISKADSAGNLIWSKQIPNPDAPGFPGGTFLPLDDDQYIFGDLINGIGNSNGHFIMVSKSDSAGNYPCSNANCKLPTAICQLISGYSNISIPNINDGELSTADS